VQCYATARHVTSRHITSHHVIYHISHHILYYIILYYIILYYIILYYIILDKNIYRNNTNEFVFITGKHCGFCHVGTEFLNTFRRTSGIAHAGRLQTPSPFLTP